MTSGVFGLRKVYKKQVQNVTDNNFESWSESATYGYYGGGYSSPPAIFYADVLRLDHSNETTSNPGNSLFGGTGTHQVAAVSNNSYGYFGGGWINPIFTPVVRNLISRLDFTNETVSEPGNNLPVERRGMSGVSGSLYGYYAGGLGPVADFSTITRLDFSSETLSAPGKNLPVDVTWFGPTQKMSTSLYGYFNGGNVPGSPGSTSQISRLDFSTENISLPGKNLPPTQHGSGLSNGSYYGYFYGGGSNITRIDLSTESLNDPGTNFPPTKDSSAINAASTSTSYGYIAGGYNENKIARLDFSNESISLPGKNLPQARRNSIGVSAGQSIYRAKGFKTYGYSCGGNIPSAISTITRLDFSSETVSDPGNNLLQPGESASVLCNNNYGYIAGGVGPSSPFDISKVFRFDFSNETLNDPGNRLPFSRRYNSGAISSSYYGYIAGGGPTNTTTSIITRLDFSNEVASNPGNNLPENLGQGVSNDIMNNLYGYFCGGTNGPGNTSTVKRLDFSNETISNPGKNLAPQARRISANVTNNSYGYIMGGFAPPDTNTIQRLDYSSETISLPGNNLPVLSENAKGFYDSYYGYHAGGFIPTVPGRTCVIYRLDFSTENVSSPGFALSQARSNMIPLMNSN